MKIKLSLNLFVLISIGWFQFSTSIHAESPTLRFPDDFAWPAVFDIGLRPKYISGLESIKVECRDQELLLSIYDDPRLFMLDEGRLSIELMHDDRLRVVEHTSRIPITLKEGELRQNEFRELVKDHITQFGSLPPIMEERIGSVMTSSEQSVVARVGEYRLSFGFNSSFQKDKPLLPRLMLSWHGDPSQPIRRETVMPPEGYEWYSLDPNVHTPDPIGFSRVVGSDESSNLPRGVGNPVERESDLSEPSVQETNRFLWLGLAALLLLALAGGWRWIRLRNAAWGQT